MGRIGGQVQVWHEQDHCMHIILQHASYADFYGTCSPSHLGPELLRQCQKVRRVSQFLGIDLHIVISAVRAAVSGKTRSGKET